ncbi:hypothetical protein BDF19DRAFT_261990 [Syncephalis fuscata]|nr:hypothetical protein BDF19DRAFT_261990 [Syncephalis fuscata]
MLGGEYMAPLRRPRTILDVCLRDCIWMQKMALSFPKCRIIGSSSVKYYIGAACTLPLNCQIVFQNSLDDLPIATDSIDYIHQQMKSFLLTKDGWARHIRNLRRVLRPGKYIELVEVDLLPSRAGPGSSRLVCMIQRLLQLRDIDPEMPRKLEPLLKQSGFKHVERLDVNVPIGEWGGPGGKLMLWLLDTVIFMIRQAVIDGINWDLFEGYNGSMVLDEMMPDTPICLNLMASAPDANYSNITANEFDALWDTTRREMTVNCSYSTMHVYLAK